MEINNEQLQKLFELSGLNVEIDDAVCDDINKALILIERKMASFASDTMAVPAEFNILIVDDLELSIFQFNQLLKKVGIVPTVARTKVEALAELKKKKYDYIVVDLFLPDAQDGIELIEECNNFFVISLCSNLIAKAFSTPPAELSLIHISYR